MQHPCLHCSTPFDITQADLDFYAKVSPVIAGKRYDIPPPKLCPDCRQQRRLAFRNERHLYHRKCDKTGRQIISVYSPDKPFPVYEQVEWWGDSWNPLDFGRVMDFSRSFSEQFQELIRVVPRRSLIYFQNENSEFTNVCSNNKNCYLLFSSDYNEECY
jgi:Zn ribbon nucleic-acid-binding protein